MAATIEIFMDALRDAVEQFAFEAFIHPVVPVLPETRALVLTYNRLFEQRVRASPICTWLDCFDDLLVPNASPAQVRPCECSQLVLLPTHQLTQVVLADCNNNDGY